MYQEKSSRRPLGEEEEEGGEAGGEGRGGAVPARAECAATRWDLEEGMSQSGRVRGTSVYSCSLRQSLFRTNLHELDAACWERKGMVW